jgi:branched-chain amino acid transport system permease protein
MARLARHRLAPVIAMAVFVLAVPLLFQSSYYYRIGALVLVFAIAACGLNLLMGFAGQVSLGHAGFLGIGAYAVAIGPAQFGMPSWLCLFAGAAASGIVALVVGRPILRLRGHYLAVATLGFGLLVNIVLGNEAGVTGGPDGVNVARLDLFGWLIRDSMSWYWISGVTFLLGAALGCNLIDSSTGRALRAIHDSEVAAGTLGVDVAGKKLAMINGHVTPDVSGFLYSIELVAMVVLGGMGSAAGPLVGAGILVLLPQVLTVLHDYEQMVLGLVIMGVMIFLRHGIMPSIMATVVRSRS